VYASQFSENKRVRLRCAAVILALDKEPIMSICDELKCSYPSIIRWLKIYDLSGTVGLTQSKTIGRKPIIPYENRGELRKIILETQNHETPLNGPGIRKILESKGYKFSKSSTYQFLSELHLTKQKPRPFHPKKDAQEVEKWIQDLPKIVEDVKSKNANKNVRIFFSRRNKIRTAGHSNISMEHKRKSTDKAKTD
jgi:transposase